VTGHRVSRGSLELGTAQMKDHTTSPR
jgi:hypothetical protein